MPVVSINRKDSASVATDKYVAQLSGSGHRVGVLIGGYLFVMAALAFVWFALGSYASCATGGCLMAGLGVLGAAALTGAELAMADVAGAVSFGNEPVPQSGDNIKRSMQNAC